MNRGQIWLLNSKTTDLDWYCSRPYQKLKFLILNLLFTPFVKPPPPGNFAFGAQRMNTGLPAVRNLTKTIECNGNQLLSLLTHADSLRADRNHSSVLKIN